MGEHPTNTNDVIKTAIICLTICIGFMFGTASNWDDYSEVKTGGYSIIGAVGALAVARKSGLL